jgi:hypothetical protein
MNSTSAINMTRLRPKESAMWEEKGDINRAKSAVLEVITDLSKELSSRFERDVPIDTRVADMTPVSSVYTKKRRKPLAAGQHETHGAWIEPPGPPKR